MPEKTPDIYSDSPVMINVALCQVNTRQWDVSHNFNVTLNALREAKSKNADMAIFPECTLHGYADNTCNDYAEQMLKSAEPIDGRHICTIQEYARELSMAVVYGFAELRQNNRFSNAAVLFDADGNLVYLYRKVHCRDFESIEHTGLFEPGNHFLTQEICLQGINVNVGTMICFDREIPESVRSLRALGSDFIACPLACDTYSISNASGEVDNEVITRVRATENEVFIAVVNHAERFNGGSYIVGPGGELLHQMDDKAGVDIVQVPISSIPGKFRSKPFSWMGWGFRRPDIYQKYLG